MSYDYYTTIIHSMYTILLERTLMHMDIYDFKCSCTKWKIQIKWLRTLNKAKEDKNMKLNSYKNSCDSYTRLNKNLIYLLLTKEYVNLIYLLLIKEFAIVHFFTISILCNRTFSRLKFIAKIYSNFECKRLISLSIIAPI